MNMLNWYKYVLATYLLFISISINLAQEPDNPVSFAIKPQYGFIIPHSKEIENVANTNPFGLELEYGRFLLKQNNFNQCNCYSKAGLSLLYMNYGNVDVVGSSYSLIGFTEPILINRQRFILTTRMGIGASYIDKIYDEVSNPTNKFFSSHITFLVHLDLNMYFKINQKLYLFSYAKYNHLSNGGIKEPNYGMNFPTFGIGANYILNHEINFLEYDKKEFSPDLFYKSYLFGTFKNVKKDTIYSLKSTFVYGVNFSFGRTISKINGISLGIEYLNDGANKELINRQDLSIDHQQVSGQITNHILFGRFDFSQSLGVYIYAPYIDRNFFQRYTLTYQFYKRIFIGVTLKAHGDIADNFNLLLGVTL